MRIDEYPGWFKRRFRHTSSFWSGLLLLAVDLLSIMFCIGTSFFIVNLANRSIIDFRSFTTYWVYLPAFAAVFYVSRLYPGIVLAPAEEVRRLATGSFFCFAGIAVSVVLETEGRAVIAMAMVAATPLASVCLPVARQAARRLLSGAGVWGVPAAVYVFEHSGNAAVDRLSRHPDLGYRPAVIVNMAADGPGQSAYGDVPEFPPTKELQDMLGRLGVKVAVVIEKADDGSGDNQRLHASVMRQYRYTLSVPLDQDIRTVYSSVRDIGGIIGFLTTRNLTKPGELLLKRLVDIILLLVAAAPTLLVTLAAAIAIKATSPGPVFYGHKRVGKNGREITVWKFRSMVANSQEILERMLAEDPALRAEWERDRKLKDDPRITGVGRFLRSTSLDELPQLWNILRGDMSFVGPRPVTRPELEKYGSQADFILSVQPGLSGMWQVSGRSDTGYEERMLLDGYYIQNWSIWLDLWIITKTIWVVLRGRGAY